MASADVIARLGILDGLAAKELTVQAEQIAFTNPSNIDPCAVRVIVSAPATTPGASCDIHTASNPATGLRYQLALSSRNDASPVFVLPPGGKLYATPSVAEGALMIQYST